MNQYEWEVDMTHAAEVASLRAMIDVLVMRAEAAEERLEKARKLSASLRHDLWVATNGKP